MLSKKQLEDICLKSKNSYKTCRYCAEDDQNSSKFYCAKMTAQKAIIDSEVEVRVDKDLNVKIIRQKPKSRMIIYFNLIGVFSWFRAMKNMIQNPVKIRVKTRYNKSNRLDI